MQDEWNGLDALMNLMGADSGKVHRCPHCGGNVNEGYAFNMPSLSECISPHAYERLAIKNWLNTLKKANAESYHRPAEDGWLTIDAEA